MTEARHIWEIRKNDFLTHCLMAGFEDEWAAYRNRDSWSKFLEESFTAYVKSSRDQFIA